LFFFPFTGDYYITRLFAGKAGVSARRKELLLFTDFLYKKEARSQSVFMS